MHEAAMTKARLEALLSVLILFFVLVIGSSLWAAPEQSKSGILQGPTADIKPSIEISPRLSGVSATYENGFGIVATIRNTSSIPVWLHPRSTVLMPPSELDPGEEINAWYATIPGGSTSKPNEDKYEKPVLLGQGESVPVAWAYQSGSSSDCNHPKSILSWVSCRYIELVQGLNFVPGDYTMKICVNYWTSEGAAKQQVDSYNTQSAEIKVAVTVTQWIVMFGAFWGALGAYFVVPNVRSVKLPEARAYFPIGLILDCRGIASAALFSIIVTILLSRLSDTQFLIKVSVNDFWGAIAVGFMATATRKTILQKLAPSNP